MKMSFIFYMLAILALFLFALITGPLIAKVIFSLLFLSIIFYLKEERDKNENS